MAKGSKPGITFTKQISDIPMSQEAWEASEDLLATLVARAIWAEYKNKLGDSTHDSDDVSVEESEEVLCNGKAE